MFHIPWQLTTIPKPALRTFWEDSLTKPHFGVTSAPQKPQGPAARWHTVSISFHNDKCLLPLIVTKKNWLKYQPTNFNETNPQPQVLQILLASFTHFVQCAFSDGVQVWRKSMKKCRCIVWLHLSKLNIFKFRSHRVVLPKLLRTGPNLAATAAGLWSKQRRPGAPVSKSWSSEEIRQTHQLRLVDVGSLSHYLLGFLPSQVQEFSHQQVITIPT